MIYFYFLTWNLLDCSSILLSSLGAFIIRNILLNLCECKEGPKRCLACCLWGEAEGTGLVKLAENMALGKALERPNSSLPIHKGQVLSRWLSCERQWTEMEQGTFLLFLMGKKKITKRLIKHGNWFPREVLKSPSSDVFSILLDKVVGNLVWIQQWPALSRNLDEKLSVVLSNHNGFVSLWNRMETPSLIAMINLLSSYLQKLCKTGSEKTSKLGEEL